MKERIEKEPIVKDLATRYAALPLPNGAGSIDAYIAQVNQIPSLSAEEELLLATRYRELGDVDAAYRLIVAHLKFVVHIAVGYLGYGLPRADLIQEGTIGLMKAVKRFDPQRGVRLASFAVHWIKAEIHEFVLCNWRIVKIATTKAQRKLFFNLRQISRKLTWFTNEEVTNIAKNLEVNPHDVRTMEARLHNQDVSFDGHSEEDGEVDYTAPANYLTADDADLALQFAEQEIQEARLSKLRKYLSKLDQRSLDIISARWLQSNKTTLGELAEKYKVSAERIRQLEASALVNLRKWLAEDGATLDLS